MTCLAAVALVATVAAAARAQDEPLRDGEWERPWEGLLPDDGQIVDPDGQGTSEWLATRVIDAATGAPIAGARLVRTPEWIAGWRRRQDVALQMARSDADGIAAVASASDAWTGNCHWMVLADGYAPTETYGVVPDELTELGRGMPLVLRVISPLGRGAAGARVDVLLGCSHGTPARSASADANGVVRFEDLPGMGGQFWIEGPQLASDLYAVSWAESLGTRPAELVGHVGLTYVGTVTDLLGAPVADVVVRGHNEERGPVAVTDHAGRFVLGGVEPDSALTFFHPADLADGSEPRLLLDAHAEFPLAVTLGPLGIVRPREDADVLVTARDAQGAPVGSVGVAFVSLATGCGPTSWTEDDEPVEGVGDPRGAVLETVPAGRVRVVPADPFGEWTFDPVDADAVAGGTTAVDVVVRRQPVLRVAGEIPDDAQVVLALDGHASSYPVDDPLPAAARAVLHVTPEGGPTFFFPVGDARDGVREVHVAVPPPTRVVAAEGYRDAALRDGVRDVCARTAADGAVETWAEGPLELVARDAAGRKRVARVALPSPPGGTVEVPADAFAEAPGETTVVLLARGDDGAWAEVERESAPPGTRVTFWGDGDDQPLSAQTPAEGETLLRRGSASLALTVVDEEGEPADALVMVAGEVHAAPEGELVVTGLDPVPVRVVVATRDAFGGGRELRLVLRDGERRAHRVQLGPTTR